MSVEINPQYLPEINILEMAQTGMILRAELEIPPNGVPVFITRLGWNELLAHYLLQNPTETRSDAHHKLLLILSRITAKLLKDAAQYCKNTPPPLPSSFIIETDLFPSSKETSLIFVRAKDHHAACALLGTQDHIRHLFA